MPEPKEVRRLVSDLRKQGFEPAVHGTPGGTWEVAIEGEHVRVTAQFAFRNGQTKRMPGTCTVDGEPHPLVHQDKLRAFWNEHESPGQPATPAALMEITDPGDQLVPYAVAAAAHTAKLSAQKAGIEFEFEIRTGISNGHWVIGIDLPGGDGLRIVFTRYGRTWELDHGQRVQVIADGHDRSAETEGDIGAALALLISARSPAPSDPLPGTGPVKQSQPARRNTGVETRHQVVIRNLTTRKDKTLYPA